MIITGLEIFIVMYIGAFWVVFPMFTKSGTGYFRSVLACHLFPLFWIPLGLILTGILESIKLGSY